MKNYKIDFEKQTVTITKDFAERAENINSEEYNILMKVRKDFKYTLHILMHHTKEVVMRIKID